MFQTILLNVNAVICLAIAVRLFLWRINHKMKNIAVSFIAFLIITACGAVSIRTMTGEYYYADWSETIINLSLFLSVYIRNGEILRWGEKK
ncbi:Protein of uncharacterised function (DUF754) [Serratia quinivorans]|uniref:Phage holin family protein n=1 Tax=Serratia proteamaculans TaxID=28151 RepID=D5FW89_SERPR|nr:MULTISPECIES: phage holin family protein [Serratia]ACZ05618.1 unknown [Serratia proteamaculans]ULG12893.1 hypothetical protein 376p_00007 [Serratia liquefaciens]ULG12999.1 hypothetical protein 377p_00005 [Serratia liquefaciens]ULG13477.1 hypothetical protein 1p_00097 [Serratia proteamaculans]ULG13812.1 hypothetical protein 12ap_00007 [Serratia proteamaculans]